MTDLQKRLEKQQELTLKYSKLDSKGVVILFQVEDRYEAYNFGADAVSQVMGMDKPYDFGCVRTVSCPTHSLDMVLPRLVRANYRVAIIESLTL